MKLSDFDYNLPKQLIAQKPVRPRDHSRLMILSRKNKTIRHDYFYNLGKYLKRKDILVINDSKVIPAKLFGKKQTGGKTEILLLKQIKNNIWEAFVTKKKINNKKFILALPTTYMNESGRVVKKLLKYYKLIPNNLVIIHDEIDIPLGKIKLSFNRSSAGHKGVQSIINYLKTKEFYRLRIGIENRKEKRIPTEEYVLKKFSKEETRIINKLKEEIFRSLLK